MKNKIYDSVYTVAPIAYLVFVVYYMNQLLNGKKDSSEVERIDSVVDEVITFNDVAGLGQAKKELVDLVINNIKKNHNLILFVTNFFFLSHYNFS